MTSRGKRGPYTRTRDEAAELRAWYERGDPWEEMAARLGITTQTLSYRLEGLGLRPDRRTPRWETAQHWPWPLTLAEVATRLYGVSGPSARRRASTLIGNWKVAGKLVGVGWGRYDLTRRPAQDDGRASRTEDTPPEEQCTDTSCT